MNSTIHIKTSESSLIMFEITAFTKKYFREQSQCIYNNYLLLYAIGYRYCINDTELIHTWQCE